MCVTVRKFAEKAYYRIYSVSQSVGKDNEAVKKVTYISLQTNLELWDFAVLFYILNGTIGNCGREKIRTKEHYRRSVFIINWSPISPVPLDAPTLKYVTVVYCRHISFLCMIQSEKESLTHLFIKICNLVTKRTGTFMILKTVCIYSGFNIFYRSFRYVQILY